MSAIATYCYTQLLKLKLLLNLNAHDIKPKASARIACLNNLWSNAVKTTTRQQCSKGRLQKRQQHYATSTIINDTDSSSLSCSGIFRPFSDYEPLELEWAGKVKHGRDYFLLHHTNTNMQQHRPSSSYQLLVIVDAAVVNAIIEVVVNVVVELLLSVLMDGIVVVVVVGIVRWLLFTAVVAVALLYQ